MSLTHIILDLETLGIKPNAVVLSIGAAAFTFEGPNNFNKLIREGFYAKLNVREQVKEYGRKIEPDTAEWWRKRSSEAKEVLQATPLDWRMADALADLNAWIKKTDYDYRKSYVWCRGNAFDFPKMESMYDQANIKCGYNGWMIRDVRTMIDVMAGVSNGKYEPKDFPSDWIAHNALHDAAGDAFRMVALFKEASE